jgi:hypothetical protein
VRAGPVEKPPRATTITCGDNHLLVRAGISISLIVLIGPSGARKTTFARELVHTGALDVAAVIASDAVGA